MREKLSVRKPNLQETARKEAKRASHVRTVTERIERIMVDDATYDMLRDLKKSTALTPAERKNLKTALQDATQRFKEQAAKF